MSSDSIVKGIIDDIINTTVKTAEVDEQKTNIYNILLINMTQSWCNGNTPLPQSFLNSSDCRTGFSAGPTEALYVAVLLSAIFGLFVCNGFAKHVPWLLISCLTYFLCNLGSKYNGRICPGFINSKSGKQSYPQSFWDWWDEGNPFKEYRIQSRDCRQLPNIELKTSSDQ